MNDKKAAETELAERRILDSLAKSVRWYGYPGCNTSNVLTDRIYRAFAKSQLEDIAGNPRLTNTVSGKVCRRFLANIEELDKAEVV
jgi:hypothetical protein